MKAYARAGSLPGCISAGSESLLERHRISSLLRNLAQTRVHESSTAVHKTDCTVPRSRIGLLQKNCQVSWNLVSSASLCLVHGRVPWLDPNHLWLVC